MSGGTFRKFVEPVTEVSPAEAEVLSQVRQCEGCCRFFDLLGSVVPRPQVRLVALIEVEKIRCGECEGESRKQKAESGKQKAESRKRKVESREQKVESGKQKAEMAVGIERSLPPEMDFTGSVLVSQTPDHREQVAGFGRSAEAARRDGEVLGLLQESFIEPSPGAWVSHQRIREVAGIDAVNSCIARIREQLPRGYDLDSRIERVENGKQYWVYRLCRTEDSERIKREKQKEESRKLKAEIL